MMEMQTWLYLQNGCKVQFVFSESSIPEDDYANALGYTNRLLALGASVNAPGLEQGEEKSDIGFIARWLKNDNDGGTSNRVDLYINHPKMLTRYLTVYVKNTPEDNAEFAKITGVHLNNVPMLPTKAPMNKEEDRNGCIVVLPKPINAIWKHNPNHKEGVLDGEPARIFIRWDTVEIPTHNPPAAQPPPASPLASQPASTPAVVVENGANGVPEQLVKEHWTNLISGVKSHSFNGVKPSGQEIANTINKMNLEGAFSGMATYQKILAAVIQRIQTHYEKTA